MTSKTDPKSSKKRSGRKRLPPLAPGPSLQFVVASHPDDFKADDTMRNIRSHVMYKHRGDQRGGSRSPRNRSKSGGSTGSMTRAVTRTPSPGTTASEGYLDDSGFLAPPSRRRSTIWDGEFYRLMSQSPSIDPMRNLAGRIIAAATAEPARSAPPTFNQGSEYPFPVASSMTDESLDELKACYLELGEFSDDREWMETVCSTRMSFLSHVSAACVFQDVTEGYLDDSSLTVYAKTKVLQMIKDSLQRVSTQMDDFTILSILHLLVSEIGGYDEDVFDVHQEGLVRIIHQRGGLTNLGLNGRIAAFLSVVMLSFTILRGHSEPSMLSGFVPSRRQSTLVELPLPISPLFAPHGNLSALYGRCNSATYEILCDMLELTNTFALRWNYVGDVFHAQAASDLASYDGHMQQIYSRLLLRPSAEDDISPDWVYESCRLAAIIYCRSIVQGVPLSDSANIMHSRSSSMDLSGTTIISALQNALDNTDKKSYWGSMSGVLLWICLVGGAASWPSLVQPTYEERDQTQTSAAWVRKCFALWAVKSAVGCGLENAGAVVEAQRAMLQVQSLINLKRGISSQ